MDFNKINKVFDNNIVKNHTNYDYNPRLWHSLNRLYRYNSKYRNLNEKQIILLNRYIHQKTILNKKLFSETFKIN